LALCSLVLGRIGGGVGMLPIMSPPPPPPGDAPAPKPTTWSEKKGASGGDVRGRARAAIGSSRLCCTQLLPGWRCVPRQQGPPGTARILLCVKVSAPSPRR